MRNIVYIALGTISAQEVLLSKMGSAGFEPYRVRRPNRSEDCLFLDFEKNLYNLILIPKFVLKCLNEILILKCR